MKKKKNLRRSMHFLEASRVVKIQGGGGGKKRPQAVNRDATKSGVTVSKWCLRSSQQPLEVVKSPPP